MSLVEPNGIDPLQSAYEISQNWKMKAVHCKHVYNHEIIEFSRLVVDYAHLFRQLFGLINITFNVVLVRGQRTAYLRSERRQEIAKPTSRH